MKKIFTSLIFVFSLVVLTNAQLTKTLSKSVDLEETHTAYIMLPGNVTVTEWEEKYLRVTTTLDVENMGESIVKRLMIIGRYNLEAKKDKYGKMMVLTMPNTTNFVTIKGVDLIERYSFEVNVPKGYNILVKEGSNSNMSYAKAKLGEL
ncbi:hypothetical protein [Aureispira anguillae]|nr:hypothetical protein [Aureispira anguillae]